MCEGAKGCISSRVSKPNISQGLMQAMGRRLTPCAVSETRKGSRCTGTEGPKGRGVCCGRRSTRAGDYLSKVLYIVTVHS